MSKSWLPFLTATLLSACGMMSNKAGIENLPTTAFSTSNTGIVVLSAGAPEHCVSQATFLSVREFETKKLVESAPSIGVDAYTHKSDFDDHHGTVNALHLPPGAYYLTPSIASPYIRTLSAPTFVFDIKAGETTYAGELFMTKACAFNMSFEIRDRFDRDMALAMKKNPLIAGRPPIKRLLKTGVLSRENQ